MRSSDGTAERELLREAFVKLFPDSLVTSFGHLVRLGVGIYDGNEGVQWNAGTERVSGQWTNYNLGVNLEGLDYDGRRPIYDLIQRELKKPLLFDDVRRLKQPQLIDVTLVRDAWGGPKRPRSRPLYYKDRHVLPRTPLDKLTETAWLSALTRVLDCFDDRGQPIYRQITFYDKNTGQSEEAPRQQFYEMTPHLHFRYILWQQIPHDLNDRVQAMQNAREHLQPLYEFARGRSA